MANRREDTDDRLVANAADADQVRDARRREKDSRKSELSDLVHLLQDPAFRRFAWRLMAKCKILGSIFESSAKIYYNSGQQDIGHFVLSEITTAQSEAFLLMMQENNKGENT